MKGNLGREKYQQRREGWGTAVKEQQK